MSMRNDKMICEKLKIVQDEGFWFKMKVFSRFCVSKMMNLGSVEGRQWRVSFNKKMNVWFYLCKGVLGFVQRAPRMKVTRCVFIYFLFIIR
jgi:hypothetical protein